MNVTDQMETIIEKPQSTKMPSCGPSPNGHIYITMLTPKIQASLQKRGLKDCTEFSVSTFSIRLEAKLPNIAQTVVGIL
ncbi:hypothetical protein STEG23_007485, partial [Scotinomys teguina]